MENVSVQMDKKIVSDNSYCRCPYYREFNGRSWCRIGYGKGECKMDFASQFHKKKL